METRIIELLCEVTENEELKDKLNATSDIINDAGLNSLQMINFVLKVEDEFDVEVDFETFDFTHLNSIEAFCNFINDNAEQAS